MHSLTMGELKAELVRRGVSTAGLLEKHEYVQALLQVLPPKPTDME